MRKPKPKFKVGDVLYSSNCVVMKVEKRYCLRSGGHRCEECGHYIPVSYSWEYIEGTGALPEDMLSLKPWRGVSYRR